MQYFVGNGYAPEAKLNYLCLLGWSPGDNRELLPLTEVREIFDLEKINRRNAIFDLDKCFWLNGQYLQLMPLGASPRLLPSWTRPALPMATPEALDKALAIVKPKVKHLSDVPSWIAFLFTEDFLIEPESAEKLKAARKHSNISPPLGEVLKDLPEWTHPAIEAKLKENRHRPRRGESRRPRSPCPRGCGVASSSALVSTKCSRWGALPVIARWRAVPPCRAQRVTDDVTLP